MKTLQIKTGRWYAIPGPEGSVSYSPVVPDMSARDVARDIDPENPPAVTEVMGTGLRLYDMSRLEGEDWKVYGNNAQALSAAAFRIKDTA